MLLAATGAVPETAYDPVEAAGAFLRLLLQQFPGAVAAATVRGRGGPGSPLRAVWPGGGRCCPAASPTWSGRGPES